MPNISLMPAQGQNITIQMDVFNYKYFLMQTAASIFEGITKTLNDVEFGHESYDTLKKYTNWPEIGYVNALQSQVAFLYDSIPIVVESKAVFTAKEKELIKVALTAYQKYKDDLVSESQKNTPFALKDWTDRNKLI